MNAYMFTSCYIITLAVVLDFIIGDPEWFYHPVRMIGAIINKLEQSLRYVFSANIKFAGILLVVMTVSIVYVACFGILKMTSHINVWAVYVLEAIMIFFTLSIKSLAKEGVIIGGLLRRNKLEKARQRLQTIVSRDLSQESRNGLIRALLETLTENISDGIVAPIFFAIIGGAPLAMAYKAVNTLDSMVGYRNEKYKDFGWCAAKTDDVVNYIPARLTGALIVFVSFIFFKHPLKAIHVWLRDAQKGPSPNGGIPIVVFAGALDIMLGGDCMSSSGIIHIPTVGGNRIELRVQDIYWAIFYIYLVSVCMVGFYILICMVVI